MKGMRQALLITAYKDEEQLLRLVRPFLGVMRIFIHIDRRSRALDADRIRAMGLQDVEVISEYDICWGSIDHFLAIAALMRKALLHEDVFYCHIVSGQDYAIHGVKWFEREFAHAGDESFFCGRNQSIFDTVRKDWYVRYHLPSRWNHHNKWVGRADKAIVLLQKALGLKRTRLGELRVDQLKSSLVWGSCSRSACATIIRFVDEHPKFMRAANFTAIPEEMILATALNGTKYHVIESRDQCYRYMEWSTGRGSPAVLDESDWMEVERRMFTDGTAFVRKIDSTVSSGLIKRIDDILI